MRTSNPTLNERSFRELEWVGAADSFMTLRGTVQKTAVLLLLLFAAAGFTWYQFSNGGPTAAYPFIIGGLIGGLIAALVVCFKKTSAPYVAPIYAILEGLFLGGISAYFEARFPGVVIQAVGLTFGTLASLLLFYASGTIRATENFKLGVGAATGGVMLLYLASLVMRLFGWQMPFIHESGLIGIGFSVFVVVLAALNLVLDFDFIENGVEAKAPKYMEWYAGFGLIVTLVWLYLEILRLLSKLRSR